MITISGKADSYGTNYNTRRIHQLIFNSRINLLERKDKHNMPVQLTEIVKHVRYMPMTRTDMNIAMEQAAREGWNPGRNDAGLFFDTDPGGFFKAVLPDDRPVGFIFAVAYDADFGFIGLYIVLPEYRGSRIGIALGQMALEHLGSRCIGQDGVFAKVKNYERYGFQLAWRNLRFETFRNFTALSSSAIVPAADVGLAKLADYDRAMFPSRRPEFLRNWIAQPDARAIAYVDRASLRGYGVIRLCRTGCKIGPLSADSPQIAETLFFNLAAWKPADAPLYLDVPEINASAMELADRYGMRQCFGTARMYKNGLPALDISRMYGITSFELG